MFSAIRHTFFKIRVFIGAIRTGLLGLALVLIGWIFAAPPSPTELAAMALPPGTSANDPLLRAHRMAKIVVAINSDRLYAYVADQSETGMTETQLRDNIELAADGYGELSTMLRGAPETDATQKAFASPNGTQSTSTSRLSFERSGPRPTDSVKVLRLPRSGPTDADLSETSGDGRGARFVPARTD